MPADAGIYGLQQSAPRINTPFENLAQVLQVRNQQDAARGLKEQRQSIAEERRQKAALTRQEAAAAAQVRSLFARPNQPPTPEEVASILGPDKATEIFKGFEALKQVTGSNQDATRARIASVLGAIKAFPEPLRPGAYDGARAHLIADGTLKPEDAPEKYDGSFIDNALRAALKPAEQVALDKPPADYTLGDSRISGATNQPVYTAPPKPEKVTYGAPQTLMVNGRRSAVRAGSDGRMYDMNLKPIEGTAIAPEPKEGNKPSYEWAQTAEGTRYLTPEEIRKQGATKPITATDKGKYKNAEPVLSAISELSEKINTGQGILAKMGGGAAKLAAKSNYDDDVAEFQALVEGFTPLMARALGHTGVLTQQDVDSVKALFPQPGNSKTLRDRKIARVRDIFNKLEGADADGATGVVKTKSDEVVEDWVIDPKTGKLVKKGAK